MKHLTGKIALPILSCQFLLVATQMLHSAPPGFKQYTIEQFLGTNSYQGASFSPDKSKILVSNDSTGIFNAYALPVGGGGPIQLTHSKTEAIRVRGYFPNDERFLYSSDQGGNELNHIFVRKLDGTSKDLTPGDKLKAEFYGWAQDDASFFIGTTERDPRYFDVYEFDAKSFERKLIYKNEQGLDVAAISPNKRFMALSKIVSNDDTDIYLFDTHTNETKLLTDDKEPAQNRPQDFGLDGKHLYFLTDKGAEFYSLARYELATGNVEQVLRPDWDVSFAGFSKKGKYLTVGINADARTELRVYNAKTMQPIELPTLPDTNIVTVGISRDETAMAFYAGSAKMPGDLFYHDLSGGQPRQLTRSLNKAINPDHLVEGRVVRFESYDGLKIPGILYQPHQADAGNRVPALVWVHGGPGGQSRIGYSALIQYLVNHGYAVYAINNRGSSGYGKTFFHLDDRKHGDADLGDVVACKKLLIETGYIDPGKIGIIGGSYGGYMTLAALTFRPTEFEVGVDIFGISNWHRTVKSIPPWWASFKASLEREMGDFDDEEFFRAKSPLFHAKNIVKPLMVLQGANDPRVLKVESDEIVKAVRANGVPVEYFLFDDEGHGFAKKKNQERGYKAILDFLDKYLN